MLRAQVGVVQIEIDEFRGTGRRLFKQRFHASDRDLLTPPPVQNARTAAHWFLSGITASQQEDRAHNLAAQVVARLAAVRRCPRARRAVWGRNELGHARESDRDIQKASLRRTRLTLASGPTLAFDRASLRTSAHHGRNVPKSRRPGRHEIILFFGVVCCAATSPSRKFICERYGTKQSRKKIRPCPSMTTFRACGTRSK